MRRNGTRIRHISQKGGGAKIRHTLIHHNQGMMEENDTPAIIKIKNISESKRCFY